MLVTIREAWGWIGLDAAEIVDSNPFGNLIVRAVDGAYWRICPEELSCEKIAGNAAEFARLLKDHEFLLDWKMSRLVKLAKRKLGPVAEGRCYCFKIPGVLGGEYAEAANFGTISLRELIALSGDLAAKIKDVPDGDQIVIEWV